MKGGSINSGSIGKAANQAKTTADGATSRKAVSTTAPKTERPAAQPDQLQNRVSARPSKPPTAQPSALEKPVRTPNKKAHNLKVRKPDFNSQEHKQLLAKKGEDAARRELKKGKQFNSFRSMKHNSIQGIDLAALKLARNGKIKQATVVESKASRNRNLGPSSFREQTTHRYVQKSLLKAKIKKVKHADKLYEMAKNRQLGIIGSTYNNETGKVRLHKVYEPNRPKGQGSKRKR
ncbi:MAG TPA: hypothetical protein VF553_14510 [Pyrinomonadaceae bacterium]|jgi:hypothetical protein